MQFHIMHEQQVMHAHTEAKVCVVIIGLTKVQNLDFYYQDFTIRKLPEATEIHDDPLSQIFD